MPPTMRIALVTEVFDDDRRGERLTERLSEARAGGADLAVLPELPLNRWAPAFRTPVDADAEPPDGPRQRAQSSAAASAGLALLGGAIVAAEPEGARHNTALLFGSRGELLDTYRKLHLPEEQGFWETSHYEPGDEPARVVRGLPMPVGIQICSDVNRPQGCNALAAEGAEVILAPRATAGDTWDRWRLVLRACAVTSCAYLVSVNRPGGTPDFATAGPTVAIGPDGEVLLETRDRLAFVDLESDHMSAARGTYPGYLPVHADAYVRAWQRAADGRRPVG